MDREELKRQLLQTFITELDEHVDQLSTLLVGMEQEQPAAERLEALRGFLRHLHSLKGAARAVGLPELEEHAHQTEQQLEPFANGRQALNSAVVDGLFAFVDKLQAARATMAASQAGEAHPLLANGGAAAAPGAAIEAAVRVAPEKLDALLTQSGELIVTQRRISRWREDLARGLELAREAHTEWRRHGEHDGLTELGRKLGQLTRDLERLGQTLASDERIMHYAADRVDHEVRRVRLLPFAEVCRGLTRAVRDVAKSVNKQVTLVLQGQDVEIDRSILQRLKDPILHLCRNAVAHGVETQAARMRAGKSALARITVSARVRGAEVEVSVQDDGLGLNLEAIRERARQAGLAVPESVDQAAATIFLPGFSTAVSVDHLSGRGVGLDVVREQVELLHGRVTVRSQPGHGTEFILTVPLTITTVRALLTVAGGQTFAMPSTGVVALRRVSRSDIHFAEGKEVLFFQGQPLPLFSLAGVLGVRDRLATLAGDRVQIVILAAGSQRLAVAVEQLVAEQEVIVKQLPARLQGLFNVAGAAILATGEITLILHLANLFRTALQGVTSSTISSALGAATAARRHVLVVDDSVTTRTMHRALLESANYEVTVASNGEDAWQFLQSSRVDAVVSDVEMPRMDGFALTEAIRRSPRLGNLPVLLVTALEKHDERARGLDVGASAYIGKSTFEEGALLHTLQRLI